MRTTLLVRAVLLLAVTSLTATNSAQSQSSVAPVIAYLTQPEQPSNIPTKPERPRGKKIELINPELLHAKDAVPISFEQELFVNIAEEAPAKTVANKAGTAISAMTANAVSLLDEHKVYVKVHYEHRPVGGILTVRVSMTASFRGIGISTRPVTSRSTAMAIDQLTDEMVKTLVNDLTEEIKADFKAMQGDGIDSGDSELMD